MQKMIKKDLFILSFASKHAYMYDKNENFRIEYLIGSKSYMNLNDKFWYYVA